MPENNGIKFFAGMFYMALGLNASNYIINELGAGTSALVGNVTGEALCAYVAPFAGKLLFHSELPSAAFRAGGIFCILFGIISYPFFKKAYEAAFPKKD